MKSKTVASILRHVASKLSDEEIQVDAATEGDSKPEAADDELLGATSGSEEARLKALYEQIAWPLGKVYAHPYDAFKLALTYVLIAFLCQVLASHQIDIQRA